MLNSTFIPHMSGRIRIVPLIVLSFFLIAAISLVTLRHDKTRPGALGTRADTAAPATANDVADSAAQALKARPNTAFSDTDETTDPASIAPSLRGSEVDAELHFDASGQLIADLSLRRYFDYFLSTIGELNVEEIHAALLADLAQRLDPAQAERARRLLERYLDYLAAAQELNPAPNPADRLDQLFELRRQLLGEELAEGFFADEERYTRTVLAEQEILHNSALDLAERQQQLEELHRQLPEAQRQGRDEAVAHHLALEQQQQFEQLHLDAAQRYAERSALYGAEAAERLAELDQQNLRWQQRVADYQQQRAALQQQGENAAAISALRAQLFDENEQRRIEALEELGFPDLDQG